MATPTRRARKPRLSRVEQKAERVQQLLDAAWVMYGAKGYEAVTIDDVAEYAGYSRMPVYSLFGDKQNLYFELWRKLLGDLTDHLVGPLKPGGSLRRNLEALAKNVGGGQRDPNAPAPEGLFFVVQTIALSRPEISKKLQDISNAVVQRMTEMVRTSTLEPGEVLRAPPEIVAAHLIAHINGMSTVEFQTKHHYSRVRDISEIFVSIAIRREIE